MDVLVAFAHPDDETILLGGVLAMLAAKGARVHYLSATRGEGGERGEPPLCSPEDLAHVRAQELRCAVEALSGASLELLPYIDPHIEVGEEGRAFDADLETLTRQLIAHMDQVRAQVLISHGSNGEYGHPAHQLMHVAALRAVQARRRSGGVMYSFAAIWPEHPRPRLANKSDPAHFVLSIGPWFPAKLRAAQCHRTQAALFVRRSSKEAGRTLSLDEVLMREESLRRAWPPAGDEWSDPLADFLRTRCREALEERTSPI
jgi:LmbE family N-acetylglucosaminyl deacetylase